MPWPMPVSSATLPMPHTSTCCCLATLLHVAPTPSTARSPYPRRAHRTTQRQQETLLRSTQNDTETTGNFTTQYPQLRTQPWDHAKKLCWANAHAMPLASVWLAQMQPQTLFNVTNTLNHKLHTTTSRLIPFCPHTTVSTSQLTAVTATAPAEGQLAPYRRPPPKVSALIYPIIPPMHSITQSLTFLFLTSTQNITITMLRTHFTTA